MKKLLIAFAFLGFLVTSSYAVNYTTTHTNTEVTENNEDCDKCGKKDCNKKSCTAKEKKECTAKKKACCAKKAETKKACCSKKGNEKKCSKSSKVDAESKNKE